MGYTVQRMAKEEKLAKNIIEEDPIYNEVIFPYLSGDDVNSLPSQEPSRYVINFFDWDIGRARNYPICFEIVEKNVKPQREAQRDKNAKEKWWQYQRSRPKMCKAINGLNKVLVISKVTKNVTFSFIPNNSVITNGIIVFPFERFFYFTILQSSLNNEWAWTYASTLESRIRYAPSDVFETFPFPRNIPHEMEAQLKKTGEEYHKFRKQLMLKIQLGLTKTYNQLHNPYLKELTDEDLAQLESLSTKDAQKQYGKETLNLYRHLTKTEGVCSFNEAVRDIQHLRELHKQMDELVLQAYGWDEASDNGPAIDLKHNFYEVDYLPENDHIRYTISPEARKEILKRLLKLNHEIHEKEVEQAGNKKKTVKKKKESLPLFES